MTPPLDERWFAQKVALFEREFRPDDFAGLVASLGGRFNPELEVTIADIGHVYPYYYDLVMPPAPPVLSFIERYHDALLPFCQSPFLLPDHRIVQGPWLGQYKVDHFPLCDLTPETVAGKRVLDIGCNAGFDTFMLASMNPAEIIGIEPSPFYYQALFLWTVYHCPNLRFLHTGWQSLDHAALGTFDLINCEGILYHEHSPAQLLIALYSLLAPGGRLILETHVTLDDDDKARFVEGNFWGDINWWWIPSVPTTCALLRACGYDDVQVRASNPVPSKNPADPLRTLEGVPVGGRAFITARRPTDPAQISAKLAFSGDSRL